LRLLIEELLPGIEIIEDYQHPELTWGVILLAFLCLVYVIDNSTRRAELDLWIPTFQIGLEYQGMLIPDCEQLLIVQVSIITTR
jgi:hypothetical protein